MEFTNYEPCANPVVVRLLDSNEKVGNIIVPDAARQKTDFGEVMFVAGKTVYEMPNGPMEVDWAKTYPVGTIVHLRAYSGAEFEFNGQKLLSVSTEEILGILS